MPQAIEWSLATPITSPRFPSINPGMGWSRVDMLEDDRGIGATETERVRQHGAELRVFLALAHDRHVGESRIEGLDVGAFADKAVLHHQQRIDRLLHTGR